MNVKTESSNSRILMVAPQPFFRARGTPFSVLHRIRALCLAGYQVDLVTYPFGEDVEIDGLAIHRCGRPPLVRDVKIGPSVAKLLLDLPLYTMTRRMLRQNDYDIIHSHEEAAFFCVGLAKKYDLPHIYDMHSSLPHQLDNFDAYNIGIIRKVFERLELNVLTTCDGVITICPELAEIAEPICGDTPHSMIENTADDRKVFGTNDDDVRKDFELGDSPVILYTGTFEAYQGLDLLLDSMRFVVEKVPGAKLVMVGGQPDQVRQHENLVREQGLSDSVVFSGTVHPSRIPGFMAAADIIASPRSSGTNTPLKIYGYMRYGRPIVATDMLTHTQVLDENTSVLVPPTAEGLADGIVRCIADPELARRVGDAARQRAEASFSDESYVSRVIDLYERAVGPIAALPDQANAA